MPKPKLLDKPINSALISAKPRRLKVIEVKNKLVIKVVGAESVLPNLLMFSYLLQLIGADLLYKVVNTNTNQVTMFFSVSPMLFFLFKINGLLKKNVYRLDNFKIAKIFMEYFKNEISSLSFGSFSNFEIYFVKVSALDIDILKNLL